MVPLCWLGAASVVGTVTVVGTAAGAAVETALQSSEEPEGHSFALASRGDIQASSGLPCSVFSASTGGLQTQGCVTTDLTFRKIGHSNGYNSRLSNETGLPGPQSEDT